MSEVDELKLHIETLETHVARLEGIIHVMLEQLEAGTIQETAAQIKETLPRSSWTSGERREEADLGPVSQPCVDRTKGRDSGWYGLCLQRELPTLRCVRR